MAQTSAETNGFCSLSHEWVERFLYENRGSLEFPRRKQPDILRYDSGTEDDIRYLFKHYDQPMFKGIPASNIYNLSEISFHRKRSGARPIITTATNTRATASSRAPIATVMECVSATGFILPPSVIFNGETVEQEWFPKDCSLFPVWRFVSGYNGQACVELLLDWLTMFLNP